ncbi:MAG: hypothetical protein QUV04_02615 [Synechococcus sp. WH 8007]|nr:hypothetical protein [Synechococcus sp. WH 8007]
MSPQYLFLSNLRIGRLFRQMKSNPYLNWIASVLSRFLSFSKSFREYNNSYSEVDQICETDVIGGSSFLVQRRLHILAGGFDEDYFLYDEDFDYCLRLKRFGKTNFIHPGAQVAMLVSGTVHQISARTIQRYKKRSRLLFINKNFKNPWKLLLSSQCKLLW